jgi:hypothetical protein
MWNLNGGPGKPRKRNDRVIPSRKKIRNKGKGKQTEINFPFVALSFISYFLSAWAKAIYGLKKRRNKRMYVRSVQIKFSHQKVTRKPS